MTQRYYYPEQFAETIWLTEGEAHHLLHVMRTKPGETVQIFDGRGAAIEATVRETHKKKVLLELHLETRQFTPPDPRRLILATAVPKGDRFRWLIEKCTELGVTQLVPLNTTRSVVNPRESKLEKQQQYVIDACKQSGRNRLLEIAPVADLRSFLQTLPESSVVLMGSPDPEETAATALPERIHQKSGDLVMLVGPEGGFTPEEKALLKQSGVSPCCCSPHVLRTETAGLALTALVQGFLTFR